MLPRIAGPVIVQASLFAAIALAIQTGLAFLSLGVAPPAPSWGGMVGEAANLIDQDGWLLVPSGGIIALTILAFGLIGDAVRDATVEGWSATTAPAARKAKRPRAPATRRRPAPLLPTIPPADAAALADDPARDAVLAVRDLTVAFDGPGGPVTRGGPVCRSRCGPARSSASSASPAAASR